MINKIKEVMASKGYKFFENGNYNLNLIAVRNDDFFTNQFSDTLYIIYKENDVMQTLMLPWTTKAGVFGHGGEKDPYTGAETGTGVDGVAVVLEGQYLGAFKYIKNGFRYPFIEYLEQVKPMNYLRDNDKNGIITRDGKIYTGNYNTHLHPMSQPKTDGKFISYQGYNPWSAGCNGSPAKSFELLLRVVRLSSKMYGPLFTYTMLHKNDFI